MRQIFRLLQYNYLAASFTDFLTNGGFNSISQIDLSDLLNLFAVRFFLNNSKSH